MLLFQLNIAWERASRRLKKLKKLRVYYLRYSLVQVFNSSSSLWRTAGLPENKRQDIMNTLPENSVLVIYYTPNSLVLQHKTRKYDLFPSTKQRRNPNSNIVGTTPIPRGPKDTMFACALAHSPTQLPTNTATRQSNPLPRSSRWESVRDKGVRSTATILCTPSQFSACHATEVKRAIKELCCRIHDSPPPQPPSRYTRHQVTVPPSLTLLKSHTITPIMKLPLAIVRQENRNGQTSHGVYADDILPVP